MPDAVLAIDQGTTGSTALVVSRDGAVLARTYSELTQHYPHPGWVEHDPEEIWRLSLAVMERALAEARVGPRELKAIGITNQRETTLVWDRATGTPLHRAIVWQSRQTADLCDRLKADGHEALVRERTGLVIDAYFSGTKVRWILDRYPEARRRAENGELAFGTVDTWLLWKLTGGRVHATDPTNASRTMLYDIHRHRWDAELLDVLGVPRPLLPEVRPSSGVFGVTGAAGSLPDGVPVAGIAGDQQAALYGQGCWEPGMAKNTYGTGCFAMMNMGNECPISRGRAAHHGGVRRGRAAGLCPRGVDLRGGRGGPVAARRARADPERRRDRSHRAVGAGHRRGLRRPGLRRPRRAALGHGRPRRHRRPDPRLEPGPPGPRHPREHRLPDAATSSRS